MRYVYDRCFQSSQCRLLAVLNEATPIDNRPFRIKQIYVTVGDINPFIIRTIVHRGSPPTIPLIGTMLAEFSHYPVTMTGPLLPSYGHLVKFVSPGVNIITQPEKGAGSQHTMSSFPVIIFKLRKQDMSYIFIEISGHLLLQVNV